MEIVKGKGARPCECRREALKQRLLLKVPEIHRENMIANLNGLKPRPNLHYKQELAIDLIKRKPDKNYILLGDNGKGKSYFLWAFYVAAGMAGRSVWAGNTQALLKEFSDEIDARRKNEPFRASLNAAMMGVWGSRWTICLDEFDKVYPTKWTAGFLFEVLDAAYSNGHQIVIATNCMSEAELTEHWEPAGERFSRSIMRRVFDRSSTITFERIEEKKDGKTG